ncbi:MAG: 50S ribosomal protein L29 [Chthoniobacterales bacterium]|nr:50S ribosomal protein L29 [Chthoniobacterales bacterium]
MDLKEIKELTSEELSDKIGHLRREVFNFRLQQQAGQLEKPHLLRSLRREIARFQTILKQRSR